MVFQANRLLAGRTSNELNCDFLIDKIIQEFMELFKCVAQTQNAIKHAVLKVNPNGSCVADEYITNKKKHNILLHVIKRRCYMLFKFISYFFVLFWYKLRNVPHDTPLPNCSIDNKWLLYSNNSLNLWPK